jgi:hypothetical protein
MLEFFLGPPPSLAELEEAFDSMDHDGTTRGD